MDSILFNYSSPLPSPPQSPCPSPPPQVETEAEGIEIIEPEVKFFEGSPRIPEEITISESEDSESDSESSDEGSSSSSDSEKEPEDATTPDGDKDKPDNGEDPEKIKKSSERKKKTRGAPKVKGELSLEDLPKIEDLHISVPHEWTKPIGVIKSFVIPLVVVEAYRNTPALNLDSVLFLEQGDKALGLVFDIFGPVKHPHYCVRFNSKDHIDERGIKVGMQVFCAPKSAQHTSFVMVAQLEQMKGTDASWKDDYEIPTEEQEFSDDEEERAARRSKNDARKVLRGRRIARGNGQGPGLLPSPPTGLPSPQTPFIPSLVPGFVPRRGFIPRSDRPFTHFRGRGRGSQNHSRPPRPRHDLHQPPNRPPLFYRPPPQLQPLNSYPRAPQSAQGLLPTPPQPIPSPGQLIQMLQTYYPGYYEQQNQVQQQYGSGIRFGSFQGLPPPPPPPPCINTALPPPRLM